MYNTVLNLNAANRYSYKRNGNTWYDISGNDYHARGDPDSAGRGSDDDRFPTWENRNGGRFYFSGNEGLIINDDMGKFEECTHEIWFKKEGSDDSKYLADARHSGSSYFIVNCDHEISWTEWTQLVISTTDDSLSVFVDGEKIDAGSGEFEKPLDGFLGSGFRIGNRYNSSNRFKGWIAEYKIYDYALGEDRVRQYYNEKRARYV